MANLIIDDRELYETHYSPVCTYCAHLTSLSGRTCKAYPKGIPSPIWEGEHNHHQPYEGDNGIEFELHPEVVGADPTLSIEEE